MTMPPRLYFTVQNSIDPLSIISAIYAYDASVARYSCCSQPASSVIMNVSDATARAKNAKNVRISVKEMLVFQAVLESSTSTMKQEVTETRRGSVYHVMKSVTDVMDQEHLNAKPVSSLRSSRKT